MTEHLRSSARSRSTATEFHALLEKALAHDGHFHALPEDATPLEVLDIVGG